MSQTPQPERLVKYKPSGPTVASFHNSPAFVRGIRGPVGSGKSSGCVVEILSRAAEQFISPATGTRKSRWAIIRNSYPELKTTTIKTWFEWCPQEYGKYTQDSPITHHVKVGDLDMEVLFMALDRPDDVKKLLSLELTGAWINESREVPRAILDALTARVGRYPSKAQGGCKWSGVLMDTNPPDDQCWWYEFAEVETPKGFEFFSQPAGDSPEAENLANLPTDYYERIKAGKDEDWIKVYVKGEYGFVTEGKPVYTSYRDGIHAAAEKILPAHSSPLLLGADFGLTPACAIGQKLVDGRWIIVDEFIMDNSGIVRFAENLRAYMARTYPEFEVECGFGDPAGNQRSQSDERTALEIMNTHTKWKWRPAPSNDLTMRLESVITCLNRLVDGRPGILISPNCKILRKGFAGGYHRKFIKTGTGTNVHETPAKNMYSHPHDALQYLLLGGGEHDVVLGKASRKKGKREVQIAEGVDYNPLNL